jgi:hypothetical protein
MVGILTLQDEYCEPARNPPLLFETRGLSHCSPRSRVVGSPRLTSLPPLPGAGAPGFAGAAWSRFTRSPRRGACSYVAKPATWLRL